MYNIAVVEDDEQSAMHLEKLLKRFEKENNVVFNILKFKSGLDFICSEKRSI